MSLKTTLHQALRGLEGLESCAIVDWPRWKANIGSHLLWLATGLYVREVGGDIAYVSTPQDYSRERMLSRIGTGAIILRGGYFGNFWGESQRQSVLESIIAECRDNPVHLFPQSFWFSDAARRERVARVINAHPQLTIFARDLDSLAYAREHFRGARIVAAPDMVFHLAGLRGLPRGPTPRGRVLYLRRSDWEQSGFGPGELGAPDLDAGDWLSFEWYGIGRWSKATAIPGMSRLLRDGWQRGLSVPRAWIARRSWVKAIRDGEPATVAPMDDWLYPSLGWVHSAFWHLSRHRVVITNRLHGHISCLLLGIPHVLVPGPYDKMRAFHDSWSRDIEFCRLVEEPDAVAAAVEEMAALGGRGAG